MLKIISILLIKTWSPASGLVSGRLRFILVNIGTLGVILTISWHFIATFPGHTPTANRAEQGPHINVTGPRALWEMPKNKYLILAIKDISLTHDRFYYISFLFCKNL